MIAATLSATILASFASPAFAVESVKPIPTQPPTVQQPVSKPDPNVVHPGVSYGTAQVIADAIKAGVNFLL